MWPPFFLQIVQSTVAFWVPAGASLCVVSNQIHRYICLFFSKDFWIGKGLEVEWNGYTWIFWDTLIIHIRDLYHYNLHLHLHFHLPSCLYMIELLILQRLKKSVMNPSLSISMAYNVTSCQNFAKNAHFLNCWLCSKRGLPTSEITKNNPENE